MCTGDNFRYRNGRTNGHIFQRNSLVVFQGKVGQVRNRLVSLLGCHTGAIRTVLLDAHIKGKALIGITQQAGDLLGNGNISGILLVEVGEGYRLVVVFLIHGHTTSCPFDTVYKGSCQVVTSNISLTDIFCERIYVIRICINNFIEHMAYRNISAILIIAVAP